MTKREFMGERIIRYNGEIVKNITRNFTDNYKTDMVLCSCGRIMQQPTWRYHIVRPICVNFHKYTNTKLDWEPI